MDQAELGYWLRLEIAVPMILFWFGMVVLFAWLASKGSQALRRTAWIAAMIAGSAAMLFTILAIESPGWYREWMGQLLFLVVLLCWGATLHCLIWRYVPLKQKSHRRLALGFSIYLLVITAAIYVASMAILDWYNVFFLIPYGVLVALGCLVLKRGLNDQALWLDVRRNLLGR